MNPPPATACVFALAVAVSAPSAKSASGHSVAAHAAGDAEPAGAIQPPDFRNGRTGERYVPPAPRELAALLAPALTNPDSEAALEEVVDAILTHARVHGLPVMEVEAIPPASSGEPWQITVWPGLISSLSLEGGSPSQRRVVAADWSRRTGAVLDLEAVDAWLDWSHRNPFHQISLSFEPGSEPATADGLLSLHSEETVRSFVTWRDDGVEPLGPQRFSAGVEIGDPGGLPLWFTGEFIGGEDWPDYRSARGQLRWFLPWHHELRLGGGWTEAELDGFLPGLPITSSLDSVETNARYVVPLGKQAGWRVDGSLGFDFRRTRSGVEIDGELETGQGDTAQAVAELLGRRVGDRGEAVAVVTGFWSPGGLTAYDTTEDVDVLRPGAVAEYGGVRFEGLGRRELPGGWAVVGRGAAQWTSGPPLPTVQLAVSGANAVRGFDEAVVLADVGAWGGLEVQAPVWSVPRVPGRLALRPLAFADAGWARDEALDDETTLASLGVGLRLNASHHLRLAFDYGWRLTEPGGRAHFALEVSF